MTEALDFPTLTLATGAVVLALSGAMRYVASTRRTYPGFDLWVLGSFCAAATMLLGWFAGPHRAVASNTISALAMALVTAGLEAFLARRPSLGLHAAAVGATFLTSVLFSWGLPSVPARILSSELIYAAQVFWALWLVARGIPPLLGARNRLLEGALLVQGLWTVARAAMLIAGDAIPPSLLSGAGARAISFLVYPAVTAVLVYGLTDLDLQRVESDLRASMEEVRTLRGLIPICSYCKKIRNDRGSWQQVEAYVAEHTDAAFTHGICPRCMHERFPPDVEGRA